MLQEIINPLDKVQLTIFVVYSLSLFFFIMIMMKILTMIIKFKIFNYEG